MERSFEEYFQPILESLLDEGKKLTGEFSKPCQVFRELVEYTVPVGKLRRGKMVVNLLKYLKPDVTLPEIELASKIGWLLLMHEAGMLIADDILDQSESRRGKPCWYRVNNRGLPAMLDAAMLEQSVYLLLGRLLDKHHEMHNAMLQHIFDISYKTVVGQSLDVEYGSKLTDFEGYTMEMYKSVATHKTAYYALCLPIGVAMILAGMRKENDKETWDLVEEVALQLGYAAQVADDYRDCFGDPKVSGKIGSDIRNGKCTWLFVRAKEICQEMNLQSEWSQLKENYGRRDEKCEENVKEIYVILELPEEFEKFGFDAIMSVNDKLNEFPEHMQGFDRFFEDIIADMLDNI